MLRLVSLALIILTSSGVIASGYSAAQTCVTPLSYRIGPIDERFDITQDEAVQVITNAEETWERATGRELFTYATSAAFAINFIFDDRQERTIAEQALRDSLDQKENSGETIQEQYDALATQYKEFQTEYETKVAAYEQKIAAFNAEVARYNDQGGAPEDVYAELQAREAALDAEAASLAARATELQSVVDNLNALGDRGNILIEQYNNGVDTYNHRFGEPNEFTQGDYQGSFINVYSFASKDELLMVMIHELGHALGIGHVEGTSSFMYYLLQDQPNPPELSEADLAAFFQTCGSHTGILGWMQKTHRIASDLINKLFIAQ